MTNSTPNTPASAGKADGLDDIDEAARQCVRQTLEHQEAAWTPCSKIIRELIERDRAERDASDYYSAWLDLARQNIALKKQLAEQSAALVAAKEALNLAMEMGPGCSTGFIGTVQAKACDALAQIEAGRKGALS